MLPTPKEIADELLNNAFLTEDQANTIAADVYQPLKEKVEQMEKVLAKAICWQAQNSGEHGVRRLLDELNT